MKFVKNFVLAALLVSSLAVNTFAGDIEIPGIVQPPPKVMCSCDEYPPVDSNTEQAGGETSDNLLYEALAALLSMY